MLPSYWLDKPYYSLDAYCKQRFHQKVYKIALDGGLTCPNRDGTLDTRGCIFCSSRGSGDFSQSGAGFFHAVCFADEGQSEMEIFFPGEIAAALFFQGILRAKQRSVNGGRKC